MKHKTLKLLDNKLFIFFGFPKVNQIILISLSLLKHSFNAIINSILKQIYWQIRKHILKT